MSPRARSRRTSPVVAAVLAVLLAVGCAGCVGRTSGNDTDRQPGEHNPARSGDPAG